MKKWVIFDVDDVLVNFRQSLYLACKKINRDIHWDQWTSYDHPSIYGFVSQEQFREFMAQHAVLENAVVEEGVKQTLQLLRDRDYSLGLITARGWHPDGKDITNKMVRDNDLAIDKVVVSHVYTDKKSAFINQFDGEIVAYFDDSAHHVRDFLEHGVSSYLLDRPWNISEIELPRIHSISEVLDIVGMPKDQQTFNSVHDVLV